eukprot:g43788.t1
MVTPVTTDVHLLSNPRFLFSSITVDIQRKCAKPLDAANVHEVVDKKGASLTLSTFHPTTWCHKNRPTSPHADCLNVQRYLRSRFEAAVFRKWSKRS